jgi:hypothetical protein
MAQKLLGVRMKKVICCKNYLEKIMTEECTFCQSIDLCDFKAMTNKNALVIA